MWNLQFIMKKGDIFELAVSQGGVAVGVVVDIIVSTEHQTVSLCYIQNRLLVYIEQTYSDYETHEDCVDSFIDHIVVDYAVLPEYDELLKSYKSKFEEC